MREPGEGDVGSQGGTPAGKARFGGYASLKGCSVVPIRRPRFTKGFQAAIVGNRLPGSPVRSFSGAFAFLVLMNSAKQMRMPLFCIVGRETSELGAIGFFQAHRPPEVRGQVRRRSFRPGTSDFFRLQLCISDFRNAGFKRVVGRRQFSGAKIL